MKIDLTKLKMFHWFEDEEGNVYECKPDKDNLPDKDYFTYHVIEPCVYREEVSAFTCHPNYEHENNRLYQAMLNFKWFYRLMKKKYRKHMTFKPMYGFNTGYSSEFSQKCIVAMVNSGDYTLQEAIYVYCHACERCMNVLIYKYLNGADGYEEYSDEWKKCNTVCDWCRESKE